MLVAHNRAPQPPNFQATGTGGAVTRTQSDRCRGPWPVGRRFGRPARGPGRHSVHGPDGHPLSNQQEADLLPAHVPQQAGR